ncbi:hypothetical protein ACFV23_56870, partial [Streptomyces sp. NPDC059627]
MPQTSPDPTTATTPAGAAERSGGRRLNPAFRGMASLLFFDVGLSVIAYFVAELLGASNYVALLAGTVVSGLRVLWVAVRQRKADPFAVFLLALFGSGLALIFTTRDTPFINAHDAGGST